MGLSVVLSYLCVNLSNRVFSSRLCKVVSWYPSLDATVMASGFGCYIFGIRAGIGFFWAYRSYKV